MRAATWPQVCLLIGVVNGKIQDSPRRRARDSLVKSFETQKSKNKPCKKETLRLIKNASEILRSCQNFPRPKFFEVPFATPTCTYYCYELLIYNKDLHL